MNKTGNTGVIRKIGTIGLSLVLALGQFPAITLSAAEEPGKTVVKSVEGLSEDILNQELSVGAQESEIVFPDSLTVTVVRTQEVRKVKAELAAPDEDEEKIQEEESEDIEEDEDEVGEDVEDESEGESENEPEVPEEEKEEPEVIPDEPTGDAEEPADAEAPEEDSDDLLTGFVDFVFPAITVKAAEVEEEEEPEEEPTEEPVEEPSEETEMVETTESVTVDVTWSLDASRSSAESFSSENPGDHFVYQSKLPEGYEFEAELPAITVTIVGEEKYAFDQEVIIDGVKIRLMAAEGVFPKGATLSVNKVTPEQEQEVLEAVEEREGKEDVALSYTFDIKVLDKDGNELQPADSSKVKVSFTLEEISDSTLTTNIYHMKEDDGLTAEKLDVVTEGSTATAETDGFSLYALQLTATGDVYKYIDEEGKTQEIEKAKVEEVTVGSVTWEATANNEGWFVVNSDVTITERIKVSGKVKLILCDGTKLTAENGITVTGDDNAFTIYAQSTGDDAGKLEATGEYNAAGIGGGDGEDGGNIIINGGKVTATGGHEGAGIGGGKLGAGSDITIEGGTVEATGGKYAAGIGGGEEGTGSDIIIKDGKVEATGGWCGAGIGGGDEASGSDITIEDGTVKATGGKSGAGIGGGDYGTGSNIMINKGTVEANGGAHAAGIGGGKLGAGSGITIKDGKVEATGGWGGAGIGGGDYGTGSDITIEDGTVTARGGEYAAGIGGGYDRAGSDITIEDGTVEARGGEYGAGIGGGEFGAGSNITIEDGTVEATGGSGGAGIGGGCLGEGSKITISGGKVTATGGNEDPDNGLYGGGAGIGGGYEGDGSDITIEDGTVETTGGECGAGIGGGYKGDGSDITIEDGTVEATGGYYAAGIGGGYEGSGSDITIEDGTVTATGGYLGAGIGGGWKKTGDVTIKGNPEIYVAGGAEAEGIGSGQWASGKSTIDTDELLTTGTITEYPAGTQLKDFGDSSLNPRITRGTAILAHFEANGGSGTMDDQIVSVKKDTLNANIFSRANNTFKGWNTKADGSGTAYANEAKIQLDGENLVLYAQWKQAASNVINNSSENKKDYPSNPIIMPVDMPSSVISLVPPQDDAVTNTANTANRRRTTTTANTNPEPETVSEQVANPIPSTEIKDEETPTTAMQDEPQGPEDTMTDGTSSALGIILSCVGVAILAVFAGIWQFKKK